MCRTAMAGSGSMRAVTGVCATTRRSRLAPSPVACRERAASAWSTRNWSPSSAGRWFFQNGPQRVHVELEAAPWVWRLQPDGTLRSHTGLAAACLATWLDEQGRLYAETGLGLGLVHSQDMHLAADWVESGRWSPQDCLAAELPQRFGFVLSPQAQAARD